MHGNRDFLLGDAYARRAGMTLLPDPSVVLVDGQPVLLMHGDTLCTDDAPYQAFRNQSHAPEWQRAFLSKPIEERQAFAAAARAESQRYTRSVADAITDVNGAAVDAAFREHRVTRLVHGHTHRPAVHTLDCNGEPSERIVLGDWYEQGSVLQVATGQRQLTAL
jgi:UDP-2,3-diacylglucosamine hydrolase